MYLQSHEQLLLYNKKLVECYVDNHQIQEARIYCDKENVYICQDVLYETKGKLGYKYKYQISSKKDKYEDNNRGCTEIYTIDDKVGENEGDNMIDPIMGYLITNLIYRRK